MPKNIYCKKSDIEQCLARRVLCICNVILQHPLFATIEREETHKLSAIADVIHKERGEYLILKGSSDDWVYFVLEGSAKIFNRDENSAKEFIHSIAETSDAIGLEQLFGNAGSYDFSVECLEKSTILMLKRESLARIVRKNPLILANLAGILSRENQELKHRARGFVLDELKIRVLDYLKELSEIQQDSLANPISKRVPSSALTQNPSTTTINLTLSKSDTAALLGTVPATFSRCLTELEREGYLERLNHKQIKILSKFNTTQPCN